MSLLDLLESLGAGLVAALVLIGADGIDDARRARTSNSKGGTSCN